MRCALVSWWRCAHLGLVVGTLTLVGCDGESVAKQETPGRPVLVTSVRYEERVTERSLVATIRPRVESDLGFRVPGKVARRLVNVGDRVKVNQPLALLDESDLRLQLELAQAEERTARSVSVQAIADEHRGSVLKGGAISHSTYERMKAAADEARGRLARAERAVQLARNNLSYATLVTDADGLVTGTLIEAGQVVAAGQAAFRVARLGEKEAVVAVPEALIDGARSGNASVELWSQPGNRYAAVLRELAPAADLVSRTYLARFSIREADEEMALGMTATLVLAGRARDRVARLPLSALLNQGKGPAVWVVDQSSGALSLKPVTVQAYEGRDVLVAGGIAEGDLVVTLGVQKLDPGQKVRIVQAFTY